MRFLQRLRHGIANVKLKNKIIISMSLAVMSVAAVSIAASQYVNGKYELLLYESTANSLSYFSKEMETRIQSVASISDYIISDSVIQQNLVLLKNKGLSEVERATTNRRLNQQLSSYFSFTTYIIAITLTQDGNSVTIGFDSSPESAGIVSRVAEKCETGTGKEFWLSTGRADSSVLCARPIRRIENLSLEQLGILTIRVDLRKIIDNSREFMSTGQGGLDFAMFSEEGPIYPASNGEKSFKELLNRNRAFDIIKTGGEKQFVVNKRMSYTGWSYVGLLPYDSIFRSIIFSNLLFVVIILLSIGFSIYVASLLIKKTTRHFDRLIAKMRSFQAGNLEPLDFGYNYSQRGDELGVLHQSFDKMTEEFRLLIEDNYVKQLLVKDSQLKALEQQINPHFLYSTLESINWRAKDRGETIISQMVESLGNLLRSTISEKTDVITIARELDIVRSYLRIQQIRFEDRLEFFEDIDGELLRASIPKMSIQPIVENAIKYGLEENTEICSVTLSIYRRGDQLTVCVANSGSHIDEDVLSKLKSKELKPHGCGIGLDNIDSRVKLIYGKEYGLLFRNREGKAIVKIILPVRFCDGEGNLC